MIIDFSDDEDAVLGLNPKKRRARRKLEEGCLIYQ
jgi:hypothetical protein